MDTFWPLNWMLAELIASYNIFEISLCIGRPGDILRSDASTVDNFYTALSTFCLRAVTTANAFQRETVIITLSCGGSVNNLLKGGA